MFGLGKKKKAAFGGYSVNFACGKNKRGNEKFSRKIYI